MATTTGAPRRVQARTYTASSLQEVAFPLGGIGTGTVSLGGRGQLRDWEIFNRPAKDKNLPCSFFTLWCRPAGGESIARILERRLLPPFAADRGLSPWAVSGLPRLEEATFRGAYPIAEITFTDGALPLEVALEAFTPFAPFDDRTSGMPVAIFLWRLRNPAPRPIEATLVYSQLNPIGYDGIEVLRRGRRHPMFGGNVNRWRTEERLCGIQMSRPGFDGEHPGAGSLAIATTWPEVTFSEHWERSGWFDDIQNFWDDLRADGRLVDHAEATPSPPGETDVGSLGAILRVEPGATVEIPFVLTWHLPNLVNYWGPFETLPGQSVVGQRMRNWYTCQWPDAWAVAREVCARLPELAAGTRAFRDALFGSTLPEPVLDAVSSQMSIIRTTTCLRTEDGRLHGFEGCDDNAGCCPMNCTHVWNYEQALAFLFPQLERSVRMTDYEDNTLPDGEQKFRTMLPLQTGVVWNYVAAADGQMGTLLKLYREWLISADEDALRRLWPQAKKTLAFAWRHWDPDRDGVMEGEQHNTYDIEFYGPNTMCGALYLGALRAAEEMARHLGDPDADEYARIYASGRARLDRELWNGEYYRQIVRNPAPTESLKHLYPARHPSALRQGEPEPRYQYGPGCLADQLLGQWFAHVVGLGYLLPPEHVREAARSIFRYNFRSSVAAHESCQRAYAVNEEAALLQCTWPHGGRPRYPFPYADECWTGSEYAVAGLLLYEDLVEEGVAVVRAVRARHDGIRRNPWNEFECGNHYARALSSWALMLALSGYEYHGPRGRLRFAPKVAEHDFRCLFTAGAAWGTVSIRGTRAWLAVVAGRLRLRTFEIADRVYTFDPPRTVGAGEVLEVG